MALVPLIESPVWTEIMAAALQKKISGHSLLIFPYFIIFFQCRCCVPFGFGKRLETCNGVEAGGRMAALMGLHRKRERWHRIRSSPPPPAPDGLWMDRIRSFNCNGVGWVVEMPSAGRWLWALTRTDSGRMIRAVSTKNRNGQNIRCDWNEIELKSPVDRPPMFHH